MTAIIRATGLRRATAEQRARVAIYAPPGASAASPDAVQAVIHQIVDQGGLGACVGCAMCEIGEAYFLISLSWPRIWTDARRRDGNLKNTNVGTWFTSAIESVTERGFDVYEPGEEYSTKELTEPDDVASELDAYDRRQVGTERWRVPEGDLDALDDAMVRGLGAATANGVRTPYFAFFSSARSPSQADVVLGTEALGGSSNGHEQRVVAMERVDGRRQYVIQNSWGLVGGCHLPDGTFQLGCARVDESVLRSAWDVDVIKISRQS